MINIQYVFPTAIGFDNRPEIANNILPIAHEYLQKYGKPHSSETHITTYNNVDIASQMFNDDRLTHVYDWFKTICVEYLISQNIDVSQVVLHNEVSAFFAKIGKNAGHRMHSHPQSLLSACFYIDAPENCSPIIFYDPRPYNKYVLYPVIQNGNLQSLYPEFVIQPKTGMLLVWPSWLEHEVVISNNDKERIAMVFDIPLIR